MICYSYFFSNFLTFQKKISQKFKKILVSASSVIISWINIHIYTYFLIHLSKISLPYIFYNLSKWKCISWCGRSLASSFVVVAIWRPFSLWQSTWLFNGNYTFSFSTIVGKYADFCFSCTFSQNNSIVFIFQINNWKYMSTITKFILWSLCRYIRSI